VEKVVVGKEVAVAAPMVGVDWASPEDLAVGSEEAEEGLKAAVVTAVEAVVADMVVGSGSAAEGSAAVGVEDSAVGVSAMEEEVAMAEVGMEMEAGVVVAAAAEARTCESRSPHNRCRKRTQHMSCLPLRRRNSRQS
jgi:hypothetical protein